MRVVTFCCRSTSIGVFVVLTPSCRLTPWLEVIQPRPTRSGRNHFCLFGIVVLGQGGFSAFRPRVTSNVCRLATKRGI